MTLLPIAVLLSALLPPCAAAPEPYKVLEPPLDTPWTSRAGNTPWAATYPRPQLRRDLWQSLDGIWTFQPTEEIDNQAPPALPLEKEVLVPSCIESGLSGIQVMGVTNMWFGTKFSVPPLWTNNRRVLLHFEAVDYEATVYVNGDEVGSNRGGYTRFSMDITESITHSEFNEIHVYVFDPTDNLSIPQGKQTKRLSHIFYTPCTGIWQSVWLESVPENYIWGLDLTADMTGNVTVTVHTNKQQSTPLEINIVDTATGKYVAAEQLVSDKTFSFTVDSPKLWTPDSPSLYNVTIKMGDDEVASYTAFRTISSGMVDGVLRPLLNGEFVFYFGPLDQGYWPDGIYTPPTPSAMAHDLELIKRLGMNMVRKHIKVEPEVFYEACDRMGLLVIQDMPSMRVFDNRRPTDDEQAEFGRQLEVMVRQLRNHPSIAVWVIYNEGWGQITDYHPEFELTERVKRLDPTRLVDAVTGWHDHGAGDFHDNHHYAEPQCSTPWYSQPNTAYDANRIALQGEFGGIGLRPDDDNLWPLRPAIDTINETYEIHAGIESYHYRARTLLRLLREQVEMYACSGAVYTQTTDVEGEVNGLMTYDRRVVRIDEEAWREDVKADGLMATNNDATFIVFYLEATRSVNTTFHEVTNRRCCPSMWAT
ncbi:hypothetical protein VTJ49DRAFT_7724 [Mycothermus thermophilus]|uniref:Glycoside hydrolase family 2 protein n=1 Tax=Humicola insolens TaxID=85995 RepID=A0ABR3VG39_HUMIN